VTKLTFNRRLRKLADRIALLCKDTPHNSEMSVECQSIVIELHKLAGDLARIEE